MYLELVFQNPIVLKGHVVKICSIRPLENIVGVLLHEEGRTETLSGE